VPTVSVQGEGAESVAAATTPPLDKSKPPPAVPTPPPERKPEVASALPKILNFESRAADDKVWLCYGVENAASATITPQPGAVKPSEKECVSVAADVGKTYTLSARSATGEVVSRKLAVAAWASLLRSSSPCPIRSGNRGATPSPNWRKPGWRYG
jgi:hypothetical protein